MQHGKERILKMSNAPLHTPPPFSSCWYLRIRTSCIQTLFLKQHFKYFICRRGLVVSILKVPGSNLSSETCYMNKNFLDFPQSLQSKSELVPYAIAQQFLRPSEISTNNCQIFRTVTYADDKF
jgi:hypothetical protein